MFLSRLFKNAKAKTMLVLAGLTMVFGVGAAVTTVAATQQNEMVETKAGTNIDNPYLWANFDGDWKRYDMTWNQDLAEGKEWKLLSVYIPADSEFVLTDGSHWVKGTVEFESGGANSRFEKNSSGNVHLKNTASYSTYYDIYAKNPNYWNGGSDTYVKYYIATSAGYTVTRKYSKAGTDQGYDDTARELVQSGGSISAPVSNCGYGYVFDGWYTAASGGTKVTSVTSTQTVYAHWVAPSTKTVYFDCSIDTTIFGSGVKLHIWDAYGTKASDVEIASPYTTSAHKTAGLVAYKTTMNIGDSFVLYGKNGASYSMTNDYQTVDMGPVSSTYNLFILGAKSSNKFTYTYNRTTNDSVYSFTFNKVTNETEEITTKYCLKGEDFYLSGISIPDVEGYDKPSQWKEGSTTGTARSTSYTYSSVSSSYTLYAVYTIKSYTINYYRVFNGVLADWWDTGTVGANHFQTYSEIEPGFLYGFVFEGWYSDSECTTGIGSTTITGNVPKASAVYAKYSSNPDNKIVYVALPDGACYNNVTYGGVMRVWYQKSDTDSERIKDAPTNKVEGVTSTNLYMASIPSDATGFSFHSGLDNGAMQAGHRTYWTSLSDAGTHNLYVCATSADSKQDEESRYPGEWKDCYFQFQTASNSTFTLNLAKTDMAEPSNMSSGNDAEALGVSIPASYYFRVVIIINGSENSLTTVGTDSNTAACTSASGVNRAKASNITVNAYLKDNVIYLLDTSSIDGGGYLYISTTLALSDVHLTVSFQNESSVTVYPFSAARLSTVTGAAKNSAITFNSVTGLAVVPIYNFRGDKTPKAGASYSVEFSNGSGTTRTITLPQATTNPKYYISLFNAAEAANSNNALAASVAYDIGAAMDNAPNASVCNVHSSVASPLVTRYNTLAKTDAILTILEATTINTYTSTKPTYTGSSPIGLGYIYVELCADAGVTPTYVPEGARIIAGFKEEQSPLTTTLWIVLASGAAGLSAIGAAYFISKKKKRHQA